MQHRRYTKTYVNNITREAIHFFVGKQIDRFLEYLDKDFIFAFVKWYNYISQITRMFDKDLDTEYIFCTYLEQLFPS